MRIDLTGTTAIVTGSTGGIGLAIATSLAATGARVVVNGRTQARADAAVASIRARQPNAKLLAVGADVSTAEGCAALAATAPDADILVNNAGTFALVPFFDIPDAEWTKIFETNVMSGVRMSRALMPGMLARNWGRIVFISSESALNIPKEMVHYGMTKTANLSVSRGLAEMTAGTGVTVNAVLPGPTLSESVGGRMHRMAEEGGISFAEVEANFFRTRRPSSLLQRFAKPEEIANIVVYTCSKEASATNGAALRVDGGVVRSIG